MRKFANQKLNDIKAGITVVRRLDGGITIPVGYRKPTRFYQYQSYTSQAMVLTKITRRKRMK